MVYKPTYNWGGPSCMFIGIKMYVWIKMYGKTCDYMGQHAQCMFIVIIINVFLFYLF